MFKLPLLPLPYNFKVLYFDCKDTPFIRVNQRKTEKSTFTHQDFGNPPPQLFKPPTHEPRHRELSRGLSDSQWQKTCFCLSSHQID